MIKVMFLAAALALEISSLSAVLRSAGGDGVLSAFLLQHAAASAMLASAMWYFLPEKYRYPRPRVTLLLFNFAFFIPLLGLSGILIAVIVSTWRRRVVVSQPFAALTLPEFVLSLREPEGKFSQAGIKSRLEHSTVPVLLRLQSLLALQSMPPRVSSPLLQNMLGDASDDIRLVAYALLDSREKRITAEIHRELANLTKAESKDLHLMCERHLAELYWELVYSELAQDDLRTHALNQALFHADAALQVAPQETGLWLLKGRILHQLKRDEEAYRILEEAMANGLPESRVLPYIVEIIFDRGDYRTVRSLLSRISTSELTSVMKGVVDLHKHRMEHDGFFAGKGGGV